MLEQNIDKISSLIRKLYERIPRENLGDVILFGSAAVTLNGKDLKREIDDLDLFVSEAVYDALKKKFDVKEITKSNDIHYLEVGIPGIEIWKSFPGVTYLEVLKNAKKQDLSQGLLVAGMEDLKTWKRTQGRDKDLEDLKQMQ